MNYKQKIIAKHLLTSIAILAATILLIFMGAYGITGLVMELYAK